MLYYGVVFPISFIGPAHEILALIAPPATKAQTSLRNCTVSSEPSPLAHTKYRCRRRLKPKTRPLAPLNKAAF